MHPRRPFLALLAALLAAPVAAQDATPAAAAHPVSISIAPSVVSGESRTGPAISGSVGVELSRWATLEGAGTYFDRGAGASAVGVQASLLFNLPTPSRRVLPYATAGAGIYRASFDMDAPGYFGGMGGQFGTGPQFAMGGPYGIGGRYGMGGPFAPGTWGCDGTGVCPAGQMPAFYGRRIAGSMTPASDGRFGTRAFTDPAFSMGGGARLDVTSHVFVRPDVRVLFVHGDGQTDTRGIVSIAFGYRF